MSNRRYAKVAVLMGGPSTEREVSLVAQTLELMLARENLSRR